MKKIGIIGAMQVEVEYLRSLMKKAGGVKKITAGSLDFEEGSIAGVSVVLVRSGVGKVNAALCAQLLALNFKCTHIMNTGIAGAMAEGLGVFDFVVSSDAVYHDMDATGFGYKAGQVPQMDVFSFAADSQLIKAVKEAFAECEQSKGHKLIEGRVATGDQFISDKKAKDRIVRDFAPACVEMEGCAIAHACFLNKVPFVLVRCMSDCADDLSSNGYDFNESIAAELSGKLTEKILEKLA